MSGRAVGLLLIGLLILGFVMGAGLVAFAGYVVCGIYLLSRYLAADWAKNLIVERTVPTEPLETGQSIEVQVKIRNTGSWPIVWVLVEDMAPELYILSRRLRVKGERLRLMSIRAGGTRTIKYKMTFDCRGYFPIGPTVMETGDVFGLHRRHRVMDRPVYVMVYPKIVPVRGYDFASRRPIGEVRLANRLYEDPTRTAGVRPYMIGDPLQRVHWRATARTGELHSRVYEPTTLAGATLLLDFHQAGYPSQGEPSRSELAVLVACSLAYAVSVQNQPIGLASNGRDAAERIRLEAFEAEQNPDDEMTDTPLTRQEVREKFELKTENDRLRPTQVNTQRGYDQFHLIRETLARLELNDGLTLSGLVLEVAPRLPKDATVIAILPAVSVETAISLGQLRRLGFAVSVVLIGIHDLEQETVYRGRLMAEAIRDIRRINSEDDLQMLGDSSVPTEYGFAVALA